MNTIKNILKKIGQVVWSGAGLEPPQAKRLALLEAHMEYLRDIASESGWGQRLVEELDKFQVAQHVPSWDGVLPRRTDAWSYDGDETDTGPALFVRLASNELVLRLDAIANRRGIKLNDLFLEAFQDFVDEDVLHPKSDDGLYPKETGKEFGAPIPNLPAATV